MEWLTKSINYLGNFLSIIVILIIGFIIAKMAGKITKRIFQETELDSILKTAGLPPISNSLALLAEIIIITATILFTLQQLGLAIITITIIAILFGIVILGTVLVSIRDAIPNLIAGMIIKKKLNKYLGKKIQIGMSKGKLSEINAFYSTLENGDEIHIPHVYTAQNFKRSLKD